MDDGLSKAGAMAIAFGERVNALMKDPFQEAHFDCPVHGPGFFVPGETAQFSDETQKSMHRHIIIGGRVFGEITNQALGGDWILDHVEGARARGLTAVHVTSPDDVADALAALGI